MRKGSDLGLTGSTFVSSTDTHYLTKTLRIKERALLLAAAIVIVPYAIAFAIAFVFVVEPNLPWQSTPFSWVLLSAAVVVLLPVVGVFGVAVALGRRWLGPQVSCRSCCRPFYVKCAREVPKRGPEIVLSLDFWSSDPDAAEGLQHALEHTKVFICPFCGKQTPALEQGGCRVCS